MGITNFDVVQCNGLITPSVGNYYKTYFVDCNAGLDTNIGSYEKPFKTLTKAMAVSHAAIGALAQGWAGRNAIYLKNDEPETITTLAQKTDIIGTGSCDGKSFPIITGNMNIANNATYMGCRFINVGFRSPAGGGIVINIPTNPSGISFLNCTIYGDSATEATIGIQSTASESLTIQGCRFIGAFSTAAINIGAGASNALLIKDNLIESAADGIVVDAGMTCALRKAYILNNTFDVGALVVDENSDKVNISGSRGRTGSNGHLGNTFDFNAALCSDNLIAHSGNKQAQYPELDAIPS